MCIVKLETLAYVIAYAGADGRRVRLYLVLILHFFSFKNSFVVVSAGLYDLTRASKLTNLSVAREGALLFYIEKRNWCFLH